MATITVPTTTPEVPARRRLHLARFAFAAVWAVALLLVASPLGPAAAVLLVLYPLVDVAAAVVDARTSRTDRSVLTVNVVVSLAAAAGLAVAVASGIPAIVRVWGTWAVVAGLAQLVLALRRREARGRWAMIASGGISVLAGIAFVLQAGGEHPTLVGLAGYALLGGVFFLVSAVRLSARNARSVSLPTRASASS